MENRPTPQDGIRLTDQQQRRRRQRSIAIALALAGLVAIFYLYTMVEGIAMFERPL